MHSLAARLFLMLALLAGWQAALQHPIEHVDGLGTFVHLDDGRSHEGSAPLCEILDALTACTPDATPLLLAAEQPPHQFQSRAEVAPRVAEAPPFLSQGPPALLT